MNKFTLIDLINSIFKGVWFVFGKHADYALIIGLSLLSSLSILYLFKWFSNQEKIKYHKRLMLGYILQLRLYQDRLSIIASSVLQILKHNLLYIRYTLPSLVFIVVPVFLACAVLNARCGYEPVKDGERLILQVSLKNSQQEPLLFSSVGCMVSDGISLETPPLRIPSENTVLWRACIRNIEPEDEMFFTIKVGKSVVQKKVLTGSKGDCFSPTLAGFGANSALFYSGEGFIEENSAIGFVSLSVKRNSLPFLFWSLDPLWAYFIITMAFAFLLKNSINVSI